MSLAFLCLPTYLLSPYANSFCASFCWWNSHRTHHSVSEFVPPAWVLTTSIPWSVVHSLKLRERRSHPLSFLSLLWLQEKVCVENMYNFMRKRPVLWCWINNSLRFLHFRQEISIQVFHLFWWRKKSFAQENAVTVARVGVFVLGTLLLMFILYFPCAVFRG